MAKISVIVPCYNGAELLPRCIDSLLAQTHRIDEIIIVNDGSTDDTPMVAQKYADQNENIFVVSKQNGGLPQARKSGLEVSTGEHIGFVDSDDWVEPTMYERLYNAAGKTGAEISCCGMFQSFDNGSREAVAQKLADGSIITPREAYHLLHCRQDVFPYMWNKLFTRSILEDIVFPTGNFTGEDYVTVIQIIKKAKSIVTVREPLYNYWQSLSSMSRGGFKPSHYLAYENYNKAEDYLLKCFPEMKKDLYRYLSVEYMSFVIAMSRGNNYDKDMLEKIQKYVRKAAPAVIFGSDVPMLYRGSAMLFAVNHKLLTSAYRIIKK